MSVTVIMLPVVFYMFIVAAVMLCFNQNCSYEVLLLFITFGVLYALCSVFMFMCHVVFRCSIVFWYVIRLFDRMIVELLLKLVREP